MTTKIKIACVGDSITNGHGAKDLTTESYPARLQVLLENEYLVENFGVNAMTVLNNTETPYTRTEKYFNSIASNADIVILMLGTNDAKLANWARNEQNFRKDFKQLILQYKEMSSKPIVFIATSPTAWRNYGVLNDNTIIPEIVDEKVVVIQKEMAEELDCMIIDIHKKTKVMKEYFPDTIHPNSDGYQKIASFMYEGIKSDCLSLRLNKSAL